MKISLCTGIYVSHLHSGPNFKANRFYLLFLKPVPKRSVHEIVHSMHSHYVNRTFHCEVCVMNAVMAINCGNLITFPYQGSCVSVVCMKCNVFTLVKIKKLRKCIDVHLNAIKTSRNSEGKPWFSNLVAVSALTELP